MTWATVSIFILSLHLGIIAAAKHPKILGGDHTRIQLFSYQVSLRFNGQHFCGGAIISEKHVVTAGHCVQYMDEEEKDLFRIHSGTNKSNRSGNVHKVLSIRVHPKWAEDREKKEWTNDIAILTLVEPIEFNKVQNKIKLPNHGIRDFQLGQLTGWGFKAHNSQNMSTTLQNIQVGLLTSKTCKPLVEHKIKEKQFCAFTAYGVGPCNGDSGGPLVSNGELVGIFSYADTKLCADGRPDIYTNVFAYKDFINSVMNE